MMMMIVIDYSFFLSTINSGIKGSDSGIARSLPKEGDGRVA